MAMTPATTSLISRFVFWPYCAGVGYSAIGVFAARAEIAKARGADKIVALGGLCYAIPLAIFGAEHLARSRVVMNLVPVWMPWRLFWTYFVGVALFAAALSILLKRHVRLSATLLGIMFVLFVLMMDIPGVVAGPGKSIFLGLGAEGTFLRRRRLCACGKPDSRRQELACYFGALFYWGSRHFLWSGKSAASRVRARSSSARDHPGLGSGPRFLGIFAGAVLLVAGACLLANKKTREAATYLGVVILLLVLFVYLPLMIAKPLEIGGLNYVGDTLLYAGTVLVLAAATGKGSDSAKA